MHFMSWSCWLRIVSTRIAVLPVERSPMISSRWPRPTFVSASIALIPVCSGSFTGWRSTTPGALNSSARVDAKRTGLEDDASDQVGIHFSCHVDGTAGGFLDLAHDLPRLVVFKRVRRRQLDGQPPLTFGDQSLELAIDLADLTGAVLLD